MLFKGSIFCYTKLCVSRIGENVANEAKPGPGVPGGKGRLRE